MTEAQVSTPNDRQVLVERTFAAPRALVYRAYTTPALLQRWLLGPPGWSMPVCEMDVRPGGTYRWRWRDDRDGKEFGFSGVFSEVVAESRLAHSQDYDSGDIGNSMGDGGATVTVTCRDQGGKTVVSTLIEYSSKESRDGAMGTGMTRGMEASYQLLDNLLAGESDS